MIRVDKCEQPSITDTVFQLHEAHHRKRKHPHPVVRHKKHNQLTENVYGTKDLESFPIADFVRHWPKQQSSHAKSHIMYHDYPVNPTPTNTHKVHLLHPVSNVVCVRSVNLIINHLTTGQLLTNFVCRARFSKAIRFTNVVLFECQESKAIVHVHPWVSHYSNRYRGE